MIQQKQIDYCKEMDDVMVLIENIIKGAKAKKPIAELAAGELADFMAALEGLGSIGEELKNKKVMLETAGFRLGSIVDALIE